MNTATTTAHNAQAAPATPSLGQVWALLDQVADPEIPVVSLRELGILREVRLGEAGVEVVITPTYSGCPATLSQMADDVAAKLAEHGIAGKVVTQLAPAQYRLDHPRRPRQAACLRHCPAARHPRRPVRRRCPERTGAGVAVFASAARATPAVACPQCGSAHGGVVPLWLHCLQGALQMPELPGAV